MTRYRRPLKTREKKHSPVIGRTAEYLVLERACSKVPIQILQVEPICSPGLITAVAMSSMKCLFV